MYIADVLEDLYVHNQLLTTHTLLFSRTQIIFIAPRGLKRQVANDIHEDYISMDGNAKNNAYGNCMKIKIFEIFLSIIAPMNTQCSFFK